MEKTFDCYRPQTIFSKSIFIDACQKPKYTFHQRYSFAFFYA